MITDISMLQYPIERDYHTRTHSSVGADNAELFVVQGGPHFVTATHWEEIDRKIDEWVRKEFC